MGKLCGLASLLLWSGLAPAAGANLLANGGFETFTGTFAGDGGRQLLLGNTQMTGWTVVAGEIAILRVPNSYALTASEGTNFLDLVGYQNALTHGVNQSVSGLEVGRSYRFAADLGLSNIPSCVPGSTCTGPISVTVQISAGPTQVLTHDSSAPGNVWQRFSFDFIASATTVTVTVTATAKPAGGAYVGLDNLSLDEITPVPVLPYLR